MALLSLEPNIIFVSVYSGWFHDIHVIKGGAVLQVLWNQKGVGVLQVFRACRTVTRQK